MSVPDTSGAVLPPSQVAELVQSLVKALRAFQMYLPNNPIYQRAVQHVQAAFVPVWAATDELVLRVAETDFVWEDEVVYHQLSKSESLAWMLYKDGLRVLTRRAGVEHEEMARLLGVINRARFLPADAPDDLLTLLWEEEFQWISYIFAEPYSDAAPIEEQGESRPELTAEARRAQVEEDAPPKAKGIVDLEDFDSTLYFLDEAEIAYIVSAVKNEYTRDVRGGAIAALFDIFEVQPAPVVRDEVLAIVESFFPNLLNSGEFRSVAAVLREMRALADRVADLTPAQRQRLRAFEERLSEPHIVRQLVQSLDEAATRPGDEDVSEVLRELRPVALETILAMMPRLSSESVRGLLEAAADRLAAAHTPEVLRLLRIPESEALPGLVELCGRLRLQGAVPGLGDALSHREPEVRLAAVGSLAAIGSPGALAHIDRAIEDADRNVRIAAVRAAGARGYRNALRRVEAVVQGKGVRDMDLSEKMAFFEAYGAIAGAAALRTLGAMLEGRGMLRMKEPPETRACAALALGRIGTPEAREYLERAQADKEVIVRNAVSRALREATG
ncbi:MAG TPA: HEAT repeat domain-containing protein [Gemmatimonadales bacterium]|nr:HEAT repeat domain-containing protein [Gemmatimonadales bacterium]